MESNDDDDYWAEAVSDYTGYPLPSRKSLFEKLKSKEGIPLMRVNLVEHSMRAVTKDDYTAASGWQTSRGEDYRLAFYTHQEGQKVRLYTADIVFIGVLADAAGKGSLMDGGTTREGAEFKGKYGDEWNDIDLWRYVSAPKFVLEALVNPPYTTKNFSYNGVSVDDVNAVDLTSFTRTAESFDRAANFFRAQLKPLEEWSKSLGGEDSAWRGQSADVVRTLFQTLYENYDGYARQMGGRDYKSGHTLLDGGNPQSTYSDLLFQAQWDLHFEAKVLKDVWQNWADSREHDPHRSLLEELDALSDWILQNNVSLVVVNTDKLYSKLDGSSNDNDENLRDYDEVDFDTLPGFSENPGIGGLRDLNTWKTIGEQAVSRWNRNVDGYLVQAARQSLARLGKSWGEGAEDLGEEMRSKEDKSLIETYEKEQAKSDKKAAEKALDHANEQNKEAWDSLNKNFSDSNKNTQNAFDGINKNFADANNNQKQLNTGLSGLGDSFNAGLSHLGDSFPQSLNPDALGGGLNLDGGGTSLLNPDGQGTGLGGTDATTGPLNPFTNFTGLNPNSLTNSPLNTGALTAGGPHLDADGNLVHTYPDGTKTVFDPGTGQLVTTDPDGHTTTTRLNPGDLVTTPDGGHLRLNADGTLTTTGPDGTKTVFDPADGTLRTTAPDGTTTTAQLNKPIDVSGLSHGGTTPLNGALGDGNGHFDADPDADYMDYDSTPFTGGTLGGNIGGFDPAGANNTTAPPGGTPLSPGFGAGGGAGGAGAGAGAGGANAERVRTVLNDANSLSALRRTGSVAPSIDGEAMPFRQGGTQTTSTPMGGGAPMGGMQGGQSTESGDRQRTNWVDEDEDVWGTEEGGTPAVIG
ncbi:AAWKG family protein [Streptomyces sp. BBFR51]|uniref:AAWKG family protein n=1 Tax=Streptomyces sp. BBFR51 TaxID=3372856 RepID=UPI0037DC5109